MSHESGQTGLVLTRNSLREWNLRRLQVGGYLSRKNAVFGHFELRRTKAASNVRNRACFRGSKRIGEIGPVDVNAIVMMTIVIGATDNCHVDNLQSLVARLIRSRSRPSLIDGS